MTVRRAIVGVAASAAFAMLPGAAAAHGGSSYRSPGYRWNHKLPKVAPVLPGGLVSLGDGADPHVLVDAAGTGQIAYTVRPNTSSSVTRDCVLARGQAGCESSAGLIPPEAGLPQDNIDEHGPIPLAVGNELLLLSSRYPNVEALPDGSTGYPTFLWTSEDGGRSFTGPGTIGNLEITGNAVVFGGDQPQIGVITDTTTGGTFFQATPPGAFSGQQLNLGDQGPDEAYDGRLALDGSMPVAEFQDLSGHIYIREYNGTGDINSSASWSLTRIDGQGYSRLVGGPRGVWLLYQKTFSGPLFVKQIVHGRPAGDSFQATPNSHFWHAYYAITEDASGRLTLAWFNPPDLYVQSSTNGRHWSAPQIIARNVNDATRLSIAAAPDGGGFAAFEVPEQGGVTGSQIKVAAFGSFAATHQQGLGNLGGDGLGGLGGDPLASSSCTNVHFGDIDAIAEAGCFLRDPHNPNGGAAIIQGQIRLNGLEIIPDAGAEIVIDPRQHTINTTGSVRVVLRAPGVGDITLYHGELHISLAGPLAGAGNTLFDFSTSTASSLDGFPFDARIEVQIQHDAVLIPVSLKLPPYFGGITGNATLLANNATGLQLSSLHIAIPDIVLGALEVKDVSIDYTHTGNVWDGTATVNIPAGTPYFGIAAAVRFDDGDFTMGSFHVNLPFPGAPIFTDTYLNGFGGGFDIHPGARRFFGSISVGAIPLDAPNYTIAVTGSVSITFTGAGPVILEADGSGAVHGFPIANAKLIFETNGYLEVDGNVDINLDVAELKVGIVALVDLPHKQFSAQANGQLSVFGEPLISAQAVVSSIGVAACGSVDGLHAGLSYPWGGTPDPSLGLGSCDISPYVVQPATRAAATRSPARAQVTAVAGSGTPFEDIAVQGNGAPPSLILHSPSGESVVPVALGAGAASARAVFASVPQTNTTYAMIRNPGAGAWTVSPTAGSSAIVSVHVARGFDLPNVAARVVKLRSRWRLDYTVTARAGQSVTFVERAARVYHVLGTARHARGELNFVPTASAARRHAIDAIISDGGLPREQLTVAHYDAPPPSRPSTVSRLRIYRHARGFTITFGHATAAAYYLLTVNASDGRHLLRLVHGRHLLVVPARGYSDHLTAQVVAVSSFGLRGRAIGARS